MNNIVGAGLGIGIGVGAVGTAAYMAAPEAFTAAQATLEATFTDQNAHTVGEWLNALPIEWAATLVVILTKNPISLAMTRFVEALTAVSARRLDIDQYLYGTAVAMDAPIFHHTPIEPIARDKSLVVRERPQHSIDSWEPRAEP